MSDKNLNINVSGGNINVGSVSQGDNNGISIESQKITTHFDEKYLAFYEDISELKKTTGVKQDQIDSLISDIKTIQRILEKNSEPKDSLINKAKELYEKYSWAAGALKTLFAAVLP